MSKSFGPEFRLHYPWQYRLFFQKSEVARLKECVVFRIPNSTGHFRLGITLKAKGRSLDRNRVKRAVRESFRIHRDDLGAYDYNVVIPAHKTLAFPYSQRLGISLRKELGHAFRSR